MTTAQLTATIEAINASQDPTLSMTTEQAEAIRDEIADQYLTDDAALTAHDLLHNRAVFGRAF